MPLLPSFKLPLDFLLDFTPAPPCSSFASIFAAFAFFFLLNFWPPHQVNLLCSAPLVLPILSHPLTSPDRRQSSVRAFVTGYPSVLSRRYLSLCLDRKISCIILTSILLPYLLSVSLSHNRPAP